MCVWVCVFRFKAVDRTFLMITMRQKNQPAAKRARKEIKFIKFLIYFSAHPHQKNKRNRKRPAVGTRKFLRS